MADDVRPKPEPRATPSPRAVAALRPEMPSPLLSGLPWCWHGDQPFATMAAKNLEDAVACVAGAGPLVRFFSPNDTVLTLGRRVHDPARVGLSTTVARCAARGVTVLPVDRGGQATLHLPGQVVALLAVPCQRVELAGLVAALLDGAERVARLHGQHPDRGQAQDTGLWLHGRKLVSIGLRHQTGVARHGLAFNVAVDTALSREFVLCGHADSGYSDLNASPRSPLLVDVARQLATAWNLASP